MKSLIHWLTGIAPERGSLPGARSAARITLRSRVTLVLTALLALVLVVGSTAWVRETRHAIHEEIQAASRVAEQWLVVLIDETVRDGDEGLTRLMSHLGAVGRVRANQLEVYGAEGELRYVSPAPTYKAGRFAPSWFAELLTPELAARDYAAGELHIRMVPDASRAVLDAWDNVVAGLGWACALLVLGWVISRAALDRALAPLAQIRDALIRGAEGNFQTRLPAYPVAEVDLLARSYNRLADSLDSTRAQNARLEQDQAFSRELHARLEEERRVIARELHDELGQSITAVRAIAGAIMQRSEQLPPIHGSAQAILAMTGQMQDGVRSILQRLRPGSAVADVAIGDAVRDYCSLWSNHHPGIQVVLDLGTLNAPLSEKLALTVLRLLQESLTNVARHAGATQVEVSLKRIGAMLELRVRDNGRGFSGTAAPDRFGVLGMRERVSELHGELYFESPPSGGLSVCARLPHRDSTRET